MKIETIYVIENNKIGKTIGEWAEDKRIQVVATSHRRRDLSELLDGVVFFLANHNFSKEADETQEDLSRDNKAVHKVDLNATLAATNFNFHMWFDRNRPKTLLILGDDEVAKNPNLPLFLQGIEG